MIITISRQLGAGGSEVSRKLGEHLGLEVWDKELLHQESQMTGIPEPALGHIDEKAPGFRERLTMMKSSEAYFHALETLMHDLGARGNCIIVGRGGNMFLKDQPGAFHVRLIAEMPSRIRRVMERRWVNEGPAREIITQSDYQRALFYRHYFGTGWDDPLHYHLVLNTSKITFEESAALIAHIARLVCDEKAAS